MVNRRKRALAALAAVLILAGCTGGDGGDEPAENGSEDESTGMGGTLIVAATDAGETQDPHRGSSPDHSVWISLVFETLVGLDSNAEVVPGVAESWEISDDGTEYTFALRDDVTFHNGRPLVAEDVKFNLERVLDPETGAPQAGTIGTIESIETPDDHTVVLKLSRPDAGLLANLGFQGRMGLIAPEAVNDQNEIDDYVGTGPFKFVSYTVNDRLVVERNDDYWAGAPLLERVEVRVMPEADSRLAALTAGEIHMAWNVPPAQAHSEAESGRIAVQEIPAHQATFYAMNARKAPFDQQELRKAMIMAVSREDLAEAGWDGYAVPACEVFHPDSVWYLDRSCDEEGDVDGAKKLLADAGIDPSGISITLLQFDPLTFQEAQVTAAAWQALGLTVNIETVDVGTLVERMGTGDFDVYTARMTLVLDPVRPFEAFEPEVAFRHSQSGFLETDEVLSNVRAARQTADVEERRRLYDEILDAHDEYGGGFYGVRPQQFVGLSDKVKGYEQGNFYSWYQVGGLLTASVEE